MDRLIDTLMRWVVRLNRFALFYLTPVCVLAFLLRQAGLPPVADLIAALAIVVGAVQLNHLRKEQQ